MCVISMIGDHYRDRWVPEPKTWTNVVLTPPVSREEFDKLKAEVEEMKKLLKRAKEYDERNGEPECEIDEKMDLLRKVAEMVGVSLDDVIGKPKKKRARVAKTSARP